MSACVTFNPWLKQLTEFWWSWRQTSEQERVYCCFFAFRFCFDFGFMNSNYTCNRRAENNVKVTFSRGCCRGIAKVHIFLQTCSKDHDWSQTNSDDIYDFLLWKALCPDIHIEPIHLKTHTNCPTEGQGRSFFLIIIFLDALRCMWKAVRMNGSRQVAFTSKQAMSTSPENIPLQHRAQCLSVSLPAAVTLQQSVREQRWPHGDDH